MLVSYTGRGLPIESLAPTLIHVLGPVPYLAAAFRRPAPEPVLPEPVARVWSPIATWARLADEGVLLFDPLVFEVSK